MMTHLLFEDLTYKLLLTICVPLILTRIAFSHAEYSVKVRVSSDWDTLCKVYASTYDVSVDPFRKSTKMLEMQCIKLCWDYNDCMAASFYQDKCLLCSTSHISTFKEVTSQVTEPLQIYQLVLRGVDYFYPWTDNCTNGNEDWHTLNYYFNHKNKPYPVSMIQFCRDVGANGVAFKGILAGMRIYYGNSHEGYRLGCFNYHDSDAWPALRLDNTEFILQIDINRGITHIRGLTFHTNKKSYGPYGRTDGTINTSIKGYRLRSFEGVNGVFIQQLAGHFERC